MCIPLVSGGDPTLTQKYRNEHEQTWIRLRIMNNYKNIFVWSIRTSCNFMNAPLYEMTRHLTHFGWFRTLFWKITKRLSRTIFALGGVASVFLSQKGVWFSGLWILVVIKKDTCHAIQHIYGQIWVRFWSGKDTVGFGGVLGSATRIKNILSYEQHDVSDFIGGLKMIKKIKTNDPLFFRR